ncbi:MAG: DNA translocase FtsK [Cytophagaceae bacterium]|nr:DNA translocase FtsK [Cytophagaceae bacterium]
MGENTYRKPRANQQKAKKEPSKLNLEFLKDRRLHLAFGFFLLITSFCFTIAFTSYLFTGTNDQSVVEDIFNENVIESGKEIQNWLGLTGAYISYFLIYKWFGLSAFLFLPLIFFLGVKIVFKTDLVPFLKVSLISLFFIFWISVALGYLVLKFEGTTYLAFLSGGIGYIMAEIINSFIGWGTPFFLLFLLITFSIYTFNITTLFTKTEHVELTEEEDLLLNGSLNGENSADGLLAEEKKKEIDQAAVEEWLLKNKNEEKPEEIIEDEEELIPEKKVEPVKEKEKKLSVLEEDIDLVVEETKEEEIISSVTDIKYDPTLDLSSYKYPPLELLNEYEGSKVQVTKEELEANKDKIVETLSHYNIGIANIKATIGPTVTLYEIVPDAGIRISKIKSLEDDIALSLAALGIRIIAPIPGKGTIGIEVPNKNKEMVSIRSVLSTEKFLKSENELPVALGKTISNEVFVMDLAKMPHLLMAGATGQGKSVGLNILLTSLIYKKHPSQLKFVLVDPKKVELSLFNKIERHFLAKLPGTEDAIITDTKKVVHTLNSLCIEMDMRYDLLKEANCRNLKEYNKKFIDRRLNPNNGHRFMPYIVLVIDELADLMMTAGKEVETPIARLAQLARAIGIHLVVATQRPSVNVITGIIKANFPARLSFKVTSKVDSRTILDTGGAEQLIGQGDMLFSVGSELIRLQCAFVDTPEVEGICEYIGSQRGYESAYMLPEFSDEDMEEGSKGEFNFSERDSLFEEAARIIVTHQQGSTSLLQRRLKLGYNRAGRLIDQLESAGVVGPFEGSKAREVLVKDEYSLEQLLNTLQNTGKD